METYRTCSYQAVDIPPLFIQDRLTASSWAFRKVHKSMTIRASDDRNDRNWPLASAKRQILTIQDRRVPKQVAARCKDTI